MNVPTSLEASAWECVCGSGGDRGRGSWVTLAAVPLVCWAADQVAQETESQALLAKGLRVSAKLNEPLPRGEILLCWLCVRTGPRICRVGKKADAKHGSGRYGWARVMIVYQKPGPHSEYCFRGETWYLKKLKELIAWATSESEVFFEGLI